MKESSRIMRTSFLRAYGVPEEDGGSEWIFSLLVSVSSPFIRVARYAKKTAQPKTKANKRS